MGPCSLFSPPVLVSQIIRRSGEVRDVAAAGSVIGRLRRQGDKVHGHRHRGHTDGGLCCGKLHQAPSAAERPPDVPKVSMTRHPETTPRSHSVTMRVSSSRRLRRRAIRLLTFSS